MFRVVSRLRGTIIYSTIYAMRLGTVIRTLVVVAMLAMFSCRTLPVPDFSYLNDLSRAIPVRAKVVNNDIVFIHDSVPPSHYPAEDHALWYYIEGLKAVRLWEDSARARENYEKALAIDSNYAPAAYHTAAMLMLNDNVEGERYSRRAYRTDTNEVWFNSQLGRFQILNENYEEAIHFFNEMVRLQGHEPENHRILAMVYNENEQPYSAIIVLDSAERRFGVHPAISPLKRQLLIKTGQYDRALELSEELIASDPYNIDNYVIAAELCAHAKKDSLAMVHYEQALAMDSTSVDVLGSLNEFYGRRGDQANYLRTMVTLFGSREVSLERKISIFKNLTRDIDYYKEYYSQLNRLATTLYVTHPDDYEALDCYTSHLITSGDLDRALEIYKSHAQDSLPRAEVFNTILDIESFKERPDSVEHYTRLAMERLPDHHEFMLRRGTYYLVNDKYSEAERALRDALRKIKSDSLRGTTYGLIGDVQYATERPRAAFRSYSKALRLLPDDAGVLNNYAYYLSELDRDLERALEMSERAINIVPNNSTYLDTYAWILYKLGRYDEAKRFMRQAIALDPTQSEVLMCHYGDILHAMGENFMARIYWEKARDGGYDKTEIESRLAKLKKP